jgi:DNA-directed RNA polymerase specialized sigma24 family protein
VNQRKHQSISQLSPTQKTMLAMYYHEDLEPAEIAACVGLVDWNVPYWFNRR